MIAQTALKYEVQVGEDGRVELDLPFSAGAHVTIFVIETKDAFHDLLTASESSLDFWDNPFDDEDWNNVERGDVLLIPVPFTDLSSRRRRPVIVISNNAYNRRSTDIVVVTMTSNPAQADYSFSIDSSDLEGGALNQPGRVRVDKIYTLSQSIVIRTFGRVNEATRERIRQRLQDLTGKAP